MIGTTVGINFLPRAPLRYATTAIRTILLIGALGGPMHAQALQAAKGDVARAESTQIVLAELRAQNRLMHDYDQRLMSTVYWSLGSVVLLVGLLVGFGWNANARSYERDRTALRQELQGLAREDAARLQEQVLAIAAKSTEDVNLQVGRLTGAVATTAETAAKEVERKIQSQLNDMKERILVRELDALEAEADQWKERGTASLELSTAIRIISASAEIRSEYLREIRIADTLDRIRTVLKAGPDLDTSDVSDLVVSLEKIPPKFSTEVESLKTLLRTLRSS